MFRGDAKSWRLDGSIDLIDANLASYQAQRIRGPLNVRMRLGRLDLNGDLRGAGGSGEGIVGGLLGSAPRVAFQAARQADGAILLQRLDLTGQALTVSGSGGRNLLGALGFRGRAEITDASRLRTGASGSFGGPITASMARTGEPWRLTFDGRGQRLAVGMDELDRLLGPAPRLQLTGSLDDGRIAIERAALTGAKGSANA